MSSIYVSGPMRGYENFNFPAFDGLSDQLSDDGYEVINPAQHDREVYPHIEEWPGFAPGDTDLCPEFNLHEALAWDLAQVARADEFVMLPGWEDSSGATHERYVAEVTGKPIWLAHKRSGRVPYWSLEFDEEQVRISSPHAHGVPMETNVEFGNDGETIVVDPTTGGAKGQKLARFDLIPAGPLHALAEHYGRGASKYADRNWEQGYKWSLSFGALMRHLWAWWNGEDNDPELGSSHLDAAAFHVFGLREFLATHPELDDRPKRNELERTRESIRQLDAALAHAKRESERAQYPPLTLRDLTRVDL